MTSLLVAHQSFGNFSVFPIRFYYDFWPLKAVLSDFCDLKCEWEFSKINDSHFQHLGVIKITKSSSNLSIYFRMRFLILVHCVDKIMMYIARYVKCKYNDKKKCTTCIPTPNNS